MTITRKNPEKQENQRLTEIVRQLSPNQIRFIVARLESPNKKEAAEAIGLSPDTVYSWRDERELIEEAIRLIVQGASEAAQAIVTKYAVKAAMVKAGALDSNDERVRQAAATEILDRNLGKATQRQEIKIDARITDAERANRILAFLDSARERRNRPAGSSED